MTGFPCDHQPATVRSTRNEYNRAHPSAEGANPAKAAGRARGARVPGAALAKTIEHRLEALETDEAREEPPDRAELRDLQADLPLGEAAAERATRKILRSAIPRDERGRKNARARSGADRALLRQDPGPSPQDPQED
jgi:hypothetical protein